MFDIAKPSAVTGYSPAAQPPDDDAGYRGPERRTATSMLWRWLAATLDEVDYGMLLLADGAHVLHVNHAAQAELDAAHPLQLLGRELRARRPEDVAPLHEALQGAAIRGLRRLLTLGEEGRRVSVSVVPLGGLGRDERTATLVILGKREFCEALSVQGYARSHRLTPAETRVLVALCKGERPGDTAAQLGVAISTIRTQIGNIRLKTGAASIRALVRQVAVLPPLMGVLRAGMDPHLRSIDDRMLSA